MKTEPMTVSNRTLRGMFAALGILGNRSMANTLADLKVGRLLHHLAPMCEPIGPARARIAAEFANGHDVEGLSEAAAQMLATGLAAKVAEFDEEEIEFDMPTMRIVHNDLPKEKPGDDGWKNAAQLGAITSDLGVLFEFPAESKD